MSIAHLAYRLAGNVLAAAVIPTVWLQYALRGKVDELERFYQRLGIYPESYGRRFSSKRPVVWLHAVSVGEVGAAAAIIKALRSRLPEFSIVLTTATVQGWKRAHTILRPNDACFYAPIDLNMSIRNVLQRIRPDIVCLLETEIWPNLIVSSHRMGIPVALLNGRISARTINNYRKVMPLMRYTLSHIDAFSMISEQDAGRILSLGALPGRVAVNGNAKFDASDFFNDPSVRNWAASLLNLKEGVPVFVAGSTRGGEELWILEAFARIREKFRQTLLVLAPRHIERVPRVANWVTKAGFTFQFRSQLDSRQVRRKAPVVILDTIGELSAIYSVADFVFCGGSLVNKGGQNVLEPALWAKPIVYGPSMEDFADAHCLLKAAGASVTVKTARDIAEVALDWLRHPAKATAAGVAARQAILSHQGAACQHACVIERLLARQRPFHSSAAKHA